METQKLYRQGMLAKKIGMTHIFTPEGESVGVTILQVGPCYVLGVKKKDKEGYSAVQLGFEPLKKIQRINKARRGIFAKAGQGAFHHAKEVRCEHEALGWGNVGKEIRVADVFCDGELVDITGVSIGRGFSGVVRRYKVKGQPATRGTHEVRRHIGAVGCRKFPARIFKNKRMPGHHGNANVTIQSLKVMAIHSEENLMLVHGAVPGARGGILEVKKTIRGFLDSEENKAKAA